MMRCWVCAGGNTVLWKSRSIDRPLTERDLQITDDRYGATLALWRCRDCGFVFADGGDLEQLIALYERLTDLDYLHDREPRALQMRWLIDKALEAHPQARTLLDVGAGSGVLIAEARDRGLEAVGVEPSRSLVEYGRRADDLPLLQGVLPHPGLADRRFDVISLVDVLEHVIDPVGLLRHCAAALSPGGVILVVTPDLGSLTARVMGARWWHFRLAHVGYFSKPSLERAAGAAGLSMASAFRPRWYFRVHYLAARLARYLPLQGVNRLAARRRVLRAVYDRVIPLTPRDSLGVLLRADGTGR